MNFNDVINFVERVKPELDSPGVYVPMMNQYLTEQSQWGDSENPPTRVCYVMPVPESASIQNLGLSILLNIVNEQMSADYIGSVHFFPEVKMLKRMKKEGVPLFDNWLFHPLSEFDILGFSSYFSLQYFNFIPMLKMADVPIEFEQRVDSWDYPVVVLGGVQAYSAECVSPLFDAFLIGEGEEMNTRFFELYRKMRSEGHSKKEFLYEAARTIQGVYLPWAYEFTYYPSDDKTHKNQIKEYHLTKEAKQHGVPYKVLKASINFRDRKPLTKMLVSNDVGGGMMIGSIYCANSCSNLCSFCQGAHTSFPYREIPYESAKQAVGEVIKNTGSSFVIPYSFNVSDLSYLNRFMVDTLFDYNIRVTTSSERLDMITDDYVKSCVKSGARTFTVAIEGASPRSRHILNKNLTEEQILNAFECIIKNGGSKIKIYNISSYPFETKEDIEYYAVLMGKINDIKKKYKANTFIRLFFTPFNPKPHTILQWSKQNNFALDENNNPVMLRNHIDIIPKIYDAMDGNGLIKFETTSMVQLVAYCINYADRRLFPVLKAMAENPNVKYLGGMGIGGEGVDIFIDYLRQLTSLDLDYFLREHSADEIFPWEVISTGIDKKWLRMLYEKVIEVSKSPLMQEGVLRKPCYQACSYCGVCRSLDKTRGNYGESRNADGTVNKDYWDEKIYGKNRFLPVFEYGTKTEEEKTIASKINSYIKPKKSGVIRFEVNINPVYRYVDGQKLKLRFRKACLISGIPVGSEITATSDKVFMRAYYSGKEIYEVPVMDSGFVFNYSITEVINKNLDDSMTVINAEIYYTSIKKLYNDFDYTLYSIKVPETLITYEKALSYIEEYEKAEYVTVKVMERVQGYIGQYKNVKSNAKLYSDSCFVKDNNDGTITFYASLTGNISVYDFAGAVLHISRRNFYPYPANIEDYVLKLKDNVSFDMFDNTCEVCGKSIETDIWGNPVHSCKCLKHKYLGE